MNLDTGELQTYLANLEADVNNKINILIKNRNSACGEEKYIYRYVTRKMEDILGSIHKAQDKIEKHSIYFKLGT